MLRKGMALMIAVVLVMGLAGCGNGNDAEGVDKRPSQESDTEHFFNTYLSADPTSLDISLRADSYSSAVIMNVMEGLIRLEEENGEYVMAPGDAKSWTVNEAGTVWTFYLGDNKWSDGEEVTAEQYVFSLRRSADPATGCPNSWFLTPILNYDAISRGEMSSENLGVKAINSKTLEITLSSPNPAFLEMCNVTIYYPQRAEKLEEWGEKYGTEAEYTVYNGPYVVESWTHNSKIVLKKNKNYWDEEAVQLETVNYHIMSDISTIVNAYKSGELDYIAVSSQEWLQEFKNDLDSKFSYYTTATMAYNFYNTEDVLMRNKNIRKALTLAIEHEEINEMCFGGLRVPTYGWVVPTISVGETNFRETAGDVLLALKADMESAGETPKTLFIKGMEELGLGSDPSTVEITLSLAGTGDWHRTYGEYVQQVFSNEIGVKVKIDFSEWGIFNENVMNGNYQMGFMTWGAYYNDPLDVLNVFKSEWAQSGTGWESEKFDNLLDEASIEMDAKVRLSKYIEAERILLEDYVACPLATSTVNGFYKNYVYGYTDLGFSTEGFKYLYIKDRN